MEEHTPAPSQYRFEKEGIQGLLIASGDEDPHIRQMAALFLGDVGDERSVSRLINLFRDPDKGVRARALKGIVHAGSMAVDPLIAALEDEDWIVRYRAAEGLGLIGDRRAITPLISRLGDAKDHVRYISAKSLGAMPDARSIEPLAPLLEDTNEYVRSRAAMTLGEIGGTAACDSLQQAIERTNSAPTREMFIRAAERACR